MKAEDRLAVIQSIDKEIFPGHTGQNCPNIVDTGYCNGKIGGYLAHK